MSVTLLIKKKEKNERPYFNGEKYVLSKIDNSLEQTSRTFLYTKPGVHYTGTLY